MYIYKTKNKVSDIFRIENRPTITKNQEENGPFRRKTITVLPTDKSELDTNSSYSVLSNFDRTLEKIIEFLPIEDTLSCDKVSKGFRSASETWWYQKTLSFCYPSKWDMGHNSLSTLSPKRYTLQLFEHGIQEFSEFNGIKKLSNKKNCFQKFRKIFKKSVKSESPVSLHRLPEIFEKHSLEDRNWVDEKVKELCSHDHAESLMLLLTYCNPGEMALVNCFLLALLKRKFPILDTLLWNPNEQALDVIRTLAKGMLVIMEEEGDSEMVGFLQKNGITSFENPEDRAELLAHREGWQNHLL